MDWSELERRQPGLARVGRRRLLEPGVVSVATIRGDGTPRVSPVEPFLLDGALVAVDAVAVQEGRRPAA
jgi:hypothetical protein